MRILPKHFPRSAPAVAIVLFAAAILANGCDGDDSGLVAPWMPTSAGSRAGDFLSSSDYTSLVVEVQPFEGMQPTQQAIDNLTQFLEARLNKPGGVQVLVNQALPASGQTAFSIDQVRVVETHARTRYPAGSTMAAFLLMVDGESDQSGGSGRILGHAYGATSMVIYQAAIEDLSGGIGEPPRATLEATVMSHEFGHILGLVGNGSSPVDPTHHDRANGAHCTNSDCLMHYSVEIADVVANLLGGTVPALDSDCIDDLQRNGGK